MKHDSPFYCDCCGEIVVPIPKESHEYEINKFVTLTVHEGLMECDCRNCGATYVDEDFIKRFEELLDVIRNWANAENKWK